MTTLVLLVIFSRAATVPPTLTPAAFAQAPATDAERARDLWHDGSKLYDIGQYEEALRKFQSSYLAKQAPETLYSIAQCHRQLGQDSDAVTGFKRYLRASSGTDEVHRATARRLIRELEEKQRGRDPISPVGTFPTQLPPTPVTVVVNQQSPAVQLAPAPPPEAPRSWYRKPWVWAIAGGALLTAAGGFAYWNTQRDPAYERGATDPGIVSVR